LLAHSVLPPRFDSPPIVHQNVSNVSACSSRCRLCLKRDGTRAETRIRLSANWTSQFKSVGASVQSNTCSRRVRIIVSNAGYIMFRGSMKVTVSPFHSPVSPLLTLPCVTVCHHISTKFYHRTAIQTYLRSKPNLYNETVGISHLSTITTETCQRERSLKIKRTYK
jgi:hypothetical protein